MADGDGARAPHVPGRDRGRRAPGVRHLAGLPRARVEPPETFYSNGALDAGLFHSLGREAAMWGPGNMDLWHSDNESISVDEIEYGARRYLGLIHAWCG